VDERLVTDPKQTAVPTATERQVSTTADTRSENLTDRCQSVPEIQRAVAHGSSTELRLCNSLARPFASSLPKKAVLAAVRLDADPE